MASASTFILSRAGIRSLVATATLCSRTDRRRLGLIHVQPAGAAGEMHAERVQAQAKHFELDKPVFVQAARRIQPQTIASDAAASPAPRSRLLFEALLCAAELGAERLVFPAQCGEDFETMAQITEIAMLVRQAVELEHGSAPEIDMPLLELTDREVLELGGHLDVPWLLAWSCEMAGAEPCRACDGCRRRRRAFEEVGMTDPLDARSPLPAG